jgi:hypothetical protein
MKKSIYKIAAFALGATMLFSSCDKIEDFGSTNTNQATTNSPITSALLTNVLTGIGAHASVAVPALYCQYFSETQYPDVSCYSANSLSPQIWYAGSGTNAQPRNMANLFDLDNIIKTNTDPATKATAAQNGANANQIAIARILKAYIYWTLTDRWGDIPYTTALKGDPNVTYDTQESIYKDLIKELTEAIGQFEEGPAIKGDIAYSGDLTKWKKLANSMRMLMALRLSKKYPGASDYAATQFKAALADQSGSIETNADALVMNYPGTTDMKNPFFNMYDGRKDYGESATMTAVLAGLSDGRQVAFGATVTGAATTKGVPYGRLRAFIDPWCGQNPDYAYVLAPAFRKADSPLYVVTASSVLLARAEAAERGWTSETSATLYNAGITASFAQWGLTVSPSYLANPAVDLAAAGSKLDKIATQQYIAYYPDGVQGWSNWRRTNIPALTPAPDATNDPKVVPRRYMYGSSDATLTKAGYDEAVARLNGGDKMDSRIWWDE